MGGFKDGLECLLPVFSFVFWLDCFILMCGLKLVLALGLELCSG